MNFKRLESKGFKDLTATERQSIKDAYADYFDNCGDPRRRAIGYAVLFGGVPVHHIGDIDVCFRWSSLDQVAGERGGVSVGLNVGPYPVTNTNALAGWKPSESRNAWQAVREYLYSDERFTGPLSGHFGCDGVSMPLFVSTKNSKTVGGRLVDCNTILGRAGKAIGFNAVKIKGLHRFGTDMQVCTGGFFWSAENGFEDWGRQIPMNEFPFETLKRSE